VTSTRPLAKTGNEIERLLLAAGADERPGVESTRRAARALGIVPRAALLAAALVTARGVRWMSVATWSSLSLMGLVGVTALVGRATPRAAVVAVAPATPRPVSPAPQAPPSVAVVEAPASARDEAQAPAPAAGAHVARRPSAVSTPRADRLRDEADALDAVRELLAKGDAAGALLALDGYQRRFADSALREEALLLRIEALVRAGERATATAAARRFVKAYPSSVHLDRIAALLGGLPEPQAK
jgi:hypothetical protein